MTDVLLGPVIANAPTQKFKDKSDGKTYYRKQILPEGKFKYGNADLDLSADVLKLAVQSFKDGAADEVPFQWGGTQGEHNNDPQKRGGTLTRVEHVPGKGVFGYFDFSTNPETAQYVEKYPRFGVSPQILLNHQRADGKKFDVVINHVLGTSVPRMTGMSAWDKVQLSQELGEVGETFDFSTNLVEAITEVQKIVTENTDDNEDEKEGDDVTAPGGLSKELVDFLTGLKAQQDAVNKVLNDGEGGDSEIPEEFRLALEGIKKSGEDQAKEIAALKQQNVVSGWEATKAKLLRDGVPPNAIELATPIMTRLETTVINLATPDGPQESSDKAQVMSLLESMKGTVDLSDELGHQVGGKEPSDKSDSLEDITSFLDQYGI